LYLLSSLDLPSPTAASMDLPASSYEPYTLPEEDKFFGIKIKAIVSIFSINNWWL